MIDGLGRHNERRPPPLVLTQGDPSGIGPELALFAWMRRRPGDRPFYVITDPELLHRRAKSLGLTIDIAAVVAEEASTAFSKALPVVSIGCNVEGNPGAPNPSDAGPTIAAIDQAVCAVASGQASAIVTNPITKASLYRAGFDHPGHTEFLGELSAKYFATAAHPVMMLWSPDLAVVPVTIHVALAQAIARLRRDDIVKTAMIVSESLRAQFGIAEPRLAISGLNPHAGEKGAMGDEDDRIIAPAIKILQQTGFHVSGPHPADTMFHAQARATYDAAICMYHDQALIPVKTLAFDTAVNVTLGLPFVRTSPDHGTAYDIAGKGLARPDSLIAALRLATRLAAGTAGRTRAETAGSVP